MPTKKITIAFVLPSLAAGGAERVMSLVVKNLNPEMFKTTLVVIGHKKDNAYNVDGVEVIYFNKSRVLSSIPNLFNFILKKQPSIVMSCMNHLNVTIALILCFFPKIKLVTREANIKKVTYLYHLSSKPFYSGFLQYVLKHRTNAIICQSKDMADELIVEFNYNPKKIEVINNPISDEFVVKPKVPSNDIAKYITVGRLHEEKGHIRILKILSKVKHPFRYTIIGTGDWQETILKHINLLHLESHVTLINYTSEVSKYLMESNVFLQGSFAEGFPNALLESCAVGTPVLAFKAPGGTNEIIEHGVNGFLANNEDEYLDYINRLYKNSGFNPKTISDSVHSRFGKQRIIKQYSDLFIQTLTT